MNRKAILLLALALTTLGAAAAEALSPGLVGRYYQMTNSLQDYPSLPAGRKPDLERVDPQVNLAATLQPLQGTNFVDNFYVVWTGKIRIPADGKYTFFLESDDGSRLFIDGALVVDNGGSHEMTEMPGKVTLKAGDHDLKVEFFEGEEDAGCILSWKSDPIAKQVVPATVLFH